MSGDRKIKAPIAQGQTNQCRITPKWFVDKSEYLPLAATFELLVNGETTFREVHRAIQNAKRSICIICWGFQPSMYLIRDGASRSIGQLLETKGREGVQVKLLSYVVDPLWLGIGVTGWKPGEANTPGRRFAALKEQPGKNPHMQYTWEQYRYDQEWYLRYDSDQKIADKLGKEDPDGPGLDGTQRTDNLRFVGRGFSVGDRWRGNKQTYEDQDLKWQTRRTLGTSPSHHQKMVLVDYEDKDRCIGFVMGHNMLDEYWDRDDHSHRRSELANRGRNGNRPRQDISSRVTGPVVGDLVANFAQAWEKETGEALPRPDFSRYKRQQDKGERVGAAQILRTQPQYGVKDIMRGYLQAVNNATRYIYIENQYFRWPPLAEKIKECVRKQCQWGRDPAAHDPLYLFVITNADNEGMGPGTVNTYRMLGALGRADVLPQVAREERLDNAKADMARAKQEIAQERAIQQGLQTSLTRARNSTDRLRTQRLIEASQVRQKDAEARLQESERKRNELKDKDFTIAKEEPPGLKMHIATLVSDDTPDGQPWTDVYIHGKLMIIDDTFMTLGSTNINTRSMEVDSELNIAHHRHTVSQPARKKLWQLHTNSKSGREPLGQMGKAYENWEKVMNENKKRRDKKKPEASLIEFYSGTTDRSNLD